MWYILASGLRRAAPRGLRRSDYEWTPTSSSTPVSRAVSVTSNTAYNFPGGAFALLVAPGFAPATPGALHGRMSDVHTASSGIWEAMGGLSVQDMKDARSGRPSPLRIAMRTSGSFWRLALRRSGILHVLSKGPEGAKWICGSFEGFRVQGLGSCRFKF